jgi:hypothetical protein
MTEPKHITEARDRLLAEQAHIGLDLLIAEFLLANPGKTPSTTTLMELVEWSHNRTKR